MVDTGPPAKLMKKRATTACGPPREARIGDVTSPLCFRFGSGTFCLTPGVFLGGQLQQRFTSYFAVAWVLKEPLAAIQPPKVFHMA